MAWRHAALAAYDLPVPFWPSAGQLDLVSRGNGVARASARRLLQIDGWCIAERCEGARRVRSKANTRGYLSRT